VHVLVQTFKGIPIQIKVVDPSGETRVSLGERFNETAMRIQSETGADFLKDRYWADYGLRYGSREEIAAELKDEIDGTFDDARLQQAGSEALGRCETAFPDKDTLSDWLNDSDWHRRLLAVQELSRVDDSISLLIRALKDSHPQVRRMAAAALGATGDPDAIDPLCDVLLNDNSVGVRRTAGDALSDIGDPLAEPSMWRALCDPNKLVRWRAARFLADMGTKDALLFLNDASQDPEFEVRLEIESAIRRITAGANVSAPVWKLISGQD
jgi:hypothetical protein